MGYGENVLEANQNLSWICPVCRGICNCSSCRRAKGWAPTGSLYIKKGPVSMIMKLYRTIPQYLVHSQQKYCLVTGFKSVAHYLIQTHQSQRKQEEPATGNPPSANMLSSSDTGS